MNAKYLAVFFLILHFVLIEAAHRQRVFRSYPVYDNLVCWSDKAWHIPDKGSWSECAYICMETAGCVSVFFNGTHCVGIDLLPHQVQWTTCQPVAGYELYAGECPLGYEWHQDTRMCFRISTECANWTDARAICQSEGADLISFADETFRTFFQKEKVDTIGAYCFQHSHFVWVGLTDSTEEGTWKWMDGGIVFDWSLWGMNEPGGGTSENCALIDVRNLNGMNILDAPCYFDILFACGYQL